MNKKKWITVISVVVTIIIIAIATVLIFHKNNELVKATVAQENMQKNEELITTEPTSEETNEPTETPTPTEETTTPSPKASKKPTIVNPTYYIKVNNQMNTVTIYKKDANGNYTVPVKAMVCSTGYASPKNVKYKTLGKWNWGPMFGGVFTQYETLIVGNILFHSVPYLKRYDNNSLEYWEYDKLGQTCSAGCIRLTVADAKWIYDNCEIGTTVEFYSSSNPGPLGKPSAQKISDNVKCRGWDPTDPDPRNPWRKEASPAPSPTLSPTPKAQITPSPIPSVKPSPSVVPTNTKSPTTTSSSKVTATPTTSSSKTTATPKATTTPKVTPSSNTAGSKKT